MCSFPTLFFPLLASLLGISGCRSGIDPDFEATVSIPGHEDSPTPDEALIATQLRKRAAILQVAAKVTPGSPEDGKLTIRFEAANQEDAVAILDSLCQSGRLTVHAVHDQSVYLSDAARQDPSKVPPGYEILTFSLQFGEASRSEDLVVSSASLIDGSHVERARAVASGDHSVFISLTPKGGQRLLNATKKMQKGRSRLAIIYDGRIISAPVVADLLSTDFTISGFNSLQQAQALAVSLNQPLSANLLIESLKPLAP